MEKFPISAVLTVKNEEKNLKKVLDALVWVEDIVVVDDYSEDATAKIAEEAGARVFKRKRDIEGRHRNWAISQAKHNWILSIDGDEILTPKLARTLQGIIRRIEEFEREDIVGFNLPMRMFIGNIWVTHPGWNPAYQMRFFNRNFVRFSEEEVHPSLIAPQGKAYTIPPEQGVIIHFSYSDFSGLIQKINSQTSLEAQKRIRLSRTYNGFHAVRKFFSHFLKEYTVKGGWRAGLIGLYISFCAGLYQLITWFKIRELQMIADKEDEIILFIHQELLEKDGIDKFLEGLSILKKERINICIIFSRDKGIGREKAKTKERFTKYNLGIKDILECIDNPNSIQEKIEDVLKRHNGIPYENVYILSNKQAIIEAGKNTGIQTILIGKELEKEPASSSRLYAPDFSCQDIEKALEIIID